MIADSRNAPTAANGFALTSQYLLDQSGEQASELTGAGAWLHSNVWQGGRLTGTSDARGLHFALSDSLGTKRVQATVTATGLGAPELNFLTLPYGNNLGNTLATDAVPVGAGGTDATEHHFTGKERDTESGNDYFPARYYSSSMGRWLSPDWSAKVMPVPYAKLDKPQSLNLYAYLNNNPLRTNDPDGHVANPCAGRSDCRITFDTGRNLLTVTQTSVHAVTTKDKDRNEIKAITTTTNTVTFSTNHGKFAQATTQATTTTAVNGALQTPTVGATTTVDRLTAVVHMRPEVFNGAGGLAHEGTDLRRDVGVLAAELALDAGTFKTCAGSAGIACGGTIAVDGATSAGLEVKRADEKKAEAHE